MSTETLDIRVRTQGANTAARDLRNIGIAAGALTGQLSVTQRIFQGFAVAAVSRRLAAFADGFTLLQSRARLYTSSQEEANKVSEELIAIANRTRVATDAVSLTFQRLAINQDRLGLTTERVTKLTELLSKAVVIGGSNAQEAGGALRQFSQALSGNFQAAAQELNSVLEQTPGLARALADGLGVTVDQIKVLAKEGKLSSKIVIAAIESQANAIEGRFGRVAPTIGQAFQVVENSLSVFIGRVFQATNAGKLITDTLLKLGQALLRLSTDTDRLNAAMEAVGTVLGTLAIANVTQRFLGFATALDSVVASSVRLVSIPVFSFLTTLVNGAALATTALVGLGGALLGFDFSRIATAGGAAFRGLGTAVAVAHILFIHFGEVARIAMLGVVSSTGRAVAAVRALSFSQLIASLRGLTVQAGLAAVAFVKLGAAGALALGRALITPLQTLVALIRVGLVEGLKIARLALIGFASVSFAALTLGLGTFVALLFSVRNETVEVGGEAVKLRDVLVAAFQLATEALGQFFNALLTKFGAGGEGQSLVRRFFNFFVGLIRGTFEAARIVVDRIADLFRGLGSGLVSFVSAIPSAVAQSLRGNFGEAAKVLGNAFADGFTEGSQGLDKAIANAFSTELAKDQLQDLVNFGASKIDGLTARTQKIAEERRKREASPADSGQIKPDAPAAGTESLSGSLTREQKAVADLVSQFDIATKVALEFREAQDQLRSAVSKNVITQKEAARIVGELAQDKFRRLASQTDEAASATIQYNDGVRELTALARTGGISQDELAAATARLRDELLQVRDVVGGVSYFDKFFAGASNGLKRFQQSLGTTFTQISDLTTTLLDQGLSAIDKFVSTGKLDFRELALGAIAEIQKVITRLIILNAIQDYKEGGVGGIFTGLFKNRDGSEQGQTQASTQTGASQQTQGVLEQILGGGRRGDDAAGKPSGAPTDPLSVRIVAGAPALAESQVPLLEKLEELDGRNAERTTTTATEQQGLFSRLYGFFAGLPAQLGGFFKGIFGGEGGGGLGGLFSGLLGGAKSAGGGLSSALGAASSILGIFSGGGGAAGAAGAISKIFGGGMEGGGLIGPGDLGKAFIVGEKRPELFMPRSTGTVVPNIAGLGGGAQPNVNVSVVNVDDPAGTLNIMSTREGEEVIMGIVQRNRGKLREIVT